MQTYNIYDLHMTDTPEEYDDEYNTAPDYCDCENHFYDLARIIARRMGYQDVSWSDIYESWNEGEWLWHGCEAMGGLKTNCIVDEEEGIEYMVHGIVKEASWSIGLDNRERKKKEKMALCMHYISGEDRIHVEKHPIGKCSYCIYEDEIIKKRKIKIQATFYLKTEVKDRQDDSRDIIDKAINYFFDRDLLAERVYEELEYETDDDEPEVYAKLASLKVTDVPKTRKI